MAKNEYFILGCGAFGGLVADLLNNSGANVVVIDKDPKIIEQANKKYSYAICADTTNIDTLKDLGVHKATCVILGFSDVENSITTVANLIELGAQGVLIARAINKLHARVLKTLGIEHVVLPIQESASRVALQALYNFNESVYSLTHGLSWTKVTVGNEKCTKEPIKNLNIRQKLKVNIMYALHNGKLQFPIDPNTTLSIGDTIAVMCPDQHLNDAIHYFAGFDPRKKYKTK